MMFSLTCFVVALFATAGVNSLLPNAVRELAAGMGETARFVSNPVAIATNIAHTAKYIQTLPDKSQEPQTLFTLEEVEKFDGKDDRALYIIIDDYVYDIQEFVQYHPAGPEPIQKHAGRDATTAVKLSGMPSDAFRPFLKRFQVGRIIDSQKDNSTALESTFMSAKSRL